MKVNVTNELSTLIQTTRIQNGIASKELAEAIGKSPSYLSKLEKGEIKRISLDDIKNIFSYTVSSDAGDDFYEDKLPVLIRIMDAFVPNDHFRTQAWLLQLDLIDRKINVSRDLVNEVAAMMKSLDIDAGGLHSEIVRAASVEMTTNIPTDTVIIEVKDDKSRLIFHSGITTEQIRELLNGELEEVNFLAVSEVVYNLFRLKRFNKTHLIPDEAKQIINETNLLLEGFAVVPLVGFHRLYSNDILLKQERMRYGRVESGLAEPIVNDVIDTLSVANKYDPSGTTQALISFERNVKWDPAFMIKLIGMPYSELGKLSHSRKKELLERFEALIAEYNSLPAFEKEYEKY